MPFTSLEAVKRALRIPSVITDNDALITELVNEVHATILEDIGGGLSNALLTQYIQSFDITQAGMRGLRLPKWPVGAIVDLSTGTNGGSSGTSLGTDDYYVTEEGTLRLEGACASWPVGIQNVQVTWTAGFATTSSNDYMSLSLAERLTVCELYKSVATAGLRSEKIGNYSYTKQTAGDRGQDVYPSIASRIVNRYRSVFGHDPVVP